MFRRNVCDVKRSSQRGISVKHTGKTVGVPQGQTRFLCLRLIILCRQQFCRLRQDVKANVAVREKKAPHTHISFSIVTLISAISLVRLNGFVTMRESTRLVVLVDE